MPPLTDEGSPFCPGSCGFANRSPVHGNGPLFAMFRSMSVVEAGWETVEADWDNPDCHQKFLALCVAHEGLPLAAQRYRHVQSTDPARADTAAKQLDRIVILATQQLSTLQTPAPVSRRWLTWVAFAMMIVLMGFGGLLLLRSQG